MVQVLPGFDQQLGQNLAGIVDAVNNVVDPNYQVKKLIQQKALADPQYAQSLANFAYVNPGIYKKMGLNKIGDVIGSISPDLQTVMQEAQKGFVAAEAAKPSSQELQKAGAQQKLYGMTDVELQNQQLQNVAAGVNIALAKQRGTLQEQSIQENQKKLQELDLAGKGIEDAIGNYPQLKGVKLAGLASDFIAGKADSNIISQVFSTPQLAKPFQDLINLEMERLRLRNQLYVAQYVHGKDIDEQMWLRSNGVGTPDLWQKYRTDPATQEKLAQLVADPKSAKTPEDQMLLAMHNSINEKQNGANAKAIAQANVAMMRTLAQSRLPGADLQALSNQLNVTFQQLAEKTGDSYFASPSVDTLVTQKNRIFPDKKRITPGIKVVDAATGQPVDINAIIARSSGAPVNVTTPPSGTGNIDTSKPAQKTIPTRGTKESNADYWERLKKAGFSTQEATDIVSGKNQ